MIKHIEHIVIDNEIAYTQNRRVKVRMIAAKYLEAGENIESIAEHYNITLADVHAALAFYYDNRAMFDELDRRNQEQVGRYGISAEDHLAQIRSRLPRQN
jgi:uncharacterized protein (DUF433 family)